MCFSATASFGASAVLGASWHHCCGKSQNKASKAIRNYPFNLRCATIY